MSDSLPPVTIRVARPYATDDELLDNELETLTRTSVTLLGAHPRPPGLVLRFELVLASGQVVVRGEGRVVGYKPDAHRGTGGLTLRFTRLDSKSKALVDRAAAMRDRRRSSMAPLLDASPNSIAPAPFIEDSGPLPSSPELTADLGPSSEPRAATASVAAPKASARHDRDALLERLRARSKSFDPATVQRILEGHRE